jgi:hypothetical protein
MAPESRSVVVSALFRDECKYVQTVIDFRAIINTLSLFLIQAVQIRRRENLSLGSAWTLPTFFHRL